MQTWAANCSLDDLNKLALHFLLTVKSEVVAMCNQYALVLFVSLYVEKALRCDRAQEGQNLVHLGAAVQRQTTAPSGSLAIGYHSCFVA